MKKIVIALVTTIIAAVVGLRAAYAFESPFVESSDRAKIELQETESGSAVSSTVVFVVDTINWYQLCDDPPYRPDDVENEAEVCNGTVCRDIDSDRSSVDADDKRFVAKFDYLNEDIERNPTFHIRFREYESPHYTVCDLLVDAENHDFCAPYFSDPFYKSGEGPNKNKSREGGHNLYIKDVSKVFNGFRVEIEGVLKHKVDLGKLETWVSASKVGEDVDFVKFDNAVFEYTDYDHKSGFMPARFRGTVVFNEDELDGKNGTEFQFRMTIGSTTYVDRIIDVCYESNGSGTRFMCDIPEDSFIDGWEIYDINDSGNQYAFTILGKAADVVHDTRIDMRLTRDGLTSQPLDNASIGCIKPYNGGYNCWGRVVIAKRYAVDGATIDLSYAMGEDPKGYTFARLPIGVEEEAAVASPNEFSFVAHSDEITRAPFMPVEEDEEELENEDEGTEETTEERDNEESTVSSMPLAEQVGPSLPAFFSDVEHIYQAVSGDEKAGVVSCSMLPHTTATTGASLAVIFAALLAPVVIIRIRRKITH